MIMYDFMLLYDLMGYVLNYLWVMLFMVMGDCKDGLFLCVFNVVCYDGKFGGLKLGVIVGFGEVVGNFKSSFKYDLGVGYSVGGFLVVVMWDCQNGVGISIMLVDMIDYIQGIYVGVSYDFGVLKLFVGYCNYKCVFIMVVVSLCSDMYWVGVSYDVMLVFMLYGVVYKQNIKDGMDVDLILFFVCGQYVLFKCMMVYLLVGYVKVKNGQNVSLLCDVIGYVNNQVGVMMGLQYCF